MPENAPEKQEDTSNPATGGQKSAFSQAFESATPATPGGGPEPESPTRRLNEPSIGPAATVVEAAKTREESGQTTDRAAGRSNVQQESGSLGNAVRHQEGFTNDSLGHRQQAEQGETAETEAEQS